MDDQTIKHLWALRKVNLALISGLKGVLLLMEQWDDLSSEKRLSMIESLKAMVQASEKVYGSAPEVS